MFIYIFFFIIIAIFCINPKLFQNNKLRILLLVSVCIFLCFGYMTGSDWRGYEIQYNDIQTGNKVNEYKNLEFGFILYNMLFVSFGIDFWIFNIITKCLCFCVLIHFLGKYTNNNYAWGLLFFFSWLAYWDYIDFPMRNMISASIFICSYPCIYDRKLLKFLLYVFFASIFHTSALLLLFVYFFINIDLTRKKVYISLAMIFIFFVVLQNFSKSFLANLEILTKLFSNRGIGYLDTESEMFKGNLFSWGALARVFLFILIFEQGKQIIEANKYGKFILSMSFLYMVTYFLGMGIPVLNRLSLFLSVSYCACLSLLPYTFLKKFRLPLYIFVFASSFMILSKAITGSYKFIPYSNYIPYVIKGEYPDFNYRSNYNYINSPYYESNR